MNSLGFFVLYLVRVVSIIGMLISPFAARFFWHKWECARTARSWFAYSALWLLSAITAFGLVATVISYVNVHITFVR